MVVAPSFDSSLYTSAQRSASRRRDDAVLPVEQRNNRSEDKPNNTQAGLDQVRRQRVSQLNESDKQQPLQQRRPISAEEARTATPVNFDRRGFDATQVFAQIRENDDAPALIDIFV